MVFLRHLSEQINKNSKFVTFDVINLSLTSNSLRLDAVEYFINRNTENISNRFFKNDFILETAEIVLTNNTFTLNGKYFKQKRETLWAQ